MKGLSVAAVSAPAGVRREGSPLSVPQGLTSGVPCPPGVLLSSPAGASDGRGRLPSWEAGGDFI